MTSSERKPDDRFLSHLHEARPEFRNLLFGLRSINIFINSKND